MRSIKEETHDCTCLDASKNSHINGCVTKVSHKAWWPSAIHQSPSILLDRVYDSECYRCGISGLYWWLEMQALYRPTTAWRWCLKLRCDIGSHQEQVFWLTSVGFWQEIPKRFMRRKYYETWLDVSLISPVSAAVSQIKPQGLPIISSPSASALCVWWWIMLRIDVGS